MKREHGDAARRIYESTVGEFDGLRERLDGNRAEQDKLRKEEKWLAEEITRMSRILNAVKLVVKGDVPLVLSTGVPTKEELIALFADGRTRSLNDVLMELHVTPSTTRKRTLGVKIHRLEKAGIFEKPRRGFYRLKSKGKNDAKKTDGPVDRSKRPVLVRSVRGHQRSQSGGSH